MATVTEREKEYIRVADAARRLGFSPSYLYKFIRQGAIKPYQRGLGGVTLVDWAEVQRVMEVQPITPEDEHEGEA